MDGIWESGCDGAKMAVLRDTETVVEMKLCGEGVGWWEVLRSGDGGGGLGRSTKSGRVGVGRR